MNDQNSQLDEIIYGALLHDIGKIFYKGGLGNNHIEAGLEVAKGIWGKDLPQDHKIIHDCIKYHHAKDLFDNQSQACPEAWIIYEADNIAAGLDRRAEEELLEQETDPKSNRKFDPGLALRSTFSILNSNDDSRLFDEQNNFSYRLTKMGLEDSENKTPLPIYPKAGIKNDKSEYEALYLWWTRQVNNSKHKLHANPNSLLMLIESLASYAPSDTSLERLPDISLYEHLRITAAVASCMYLYCWDNSLDYKQYIDAENRANNTAFLILRGEISGIQKFIYNIQSKGALKSLRARSFYLEVLTEHIIDQLLEACGDLSRANIIYNGGGSFNLLLPNTNKSRQAIEKIEQILNQWLWDKFRGSLAFCMASVECNANDLMDPPVDSSGKEAPFNAFKKPGDRKKFIRKGLLVEKWQALTNQLSKKKQSKFSALSDEDFRSLFQPQDAVEISQECQFTRVDHNLKKRQDLTLNDFAYSLYSLGQKLPKAKLLWIYEAEQLSDDDRTRGLVELPHLLNPQKTYVLDISLQLEGVNEAVLKSNDSKRVQESKNSRLYSINRWILSEYIDSVVMIGNYYPTNEDQDMPDFDDLAKEAIGNQKIAVLRADIDDLGKLFTDKLPKEIYTFSRVAMLSKHLSLFFKLYLNQICNRKLNLSEKVSPCSLIQDDSGKKGGRNVVIVYSGGDDLFIVGAWNEVIELAVDIERCFSEYTCGKLTLSAGIQIFDIHHPLLQMATKTGEAEDKAKSYQESQSARKKNAICLFPNPRALEYKTDGTKREEKLLMKDAYSWSEFSEIVSKLKVLIQDNYHYDPKDQRLKPEQDKAWLTPSATYKLLQLAYRWSEGEKLSLPRFAYTLARSERGKMDSLKTPDWIYKMAALSNNNPYNSDAYSVTIKDCKTLFTTLNYLTRGKDDRSDNEVKAG